MENNVSKYNDLIGHSFSIKGNDYGRILAIEEIEKDNVIYFVYRMSTGKYVECESVYNYIKNFVFYPQGTAYVMRNRKRKETAAKGGMSLFGNVINNNVDLSDKKKKGGK